MEKYFDRYPLAYWVLLSQLIAGSLIGFDDLDPTTIGVPKLVSLSLVVIGASVAAGIWAHWLRKNPPYIPFVMDFPSGWNAHRPFLLIFWIGVVVVYAAEIAKVCGVLYSNGLWSFIVYAFTH
ncbi:MAG TPA: hypothetical protein VMU25_02730 [Candidatus Paceibacterota bacterium]|nr:hypothetical protein [Candidatus Paceibacterota bacterium]